MSAFSLIEILVTVALLSFIILGLLAMFTQTQKAFRGSMKQVDVMSAGRAVTDMLARELKEITPSEMPYLRNLGGPYYFSTNFFAEIPAVANVGFNPPFAETSFGGSRPLLQGLPGTTFQGQPNTQERRTNIVQQIFFLTKNNQDWIGIGYQVLGDSASAGVGTLYRFSKTRPKTSAIYLSSDFLNAPVTNLSRIADGVIHFRLRAFATNGFPIDPALLNNSGFRTNADTSGTAPMRNTWGYWDPSALDQVNSYFLSNSVPAYLELELGILEPHILEHYKGIGSGNVQAQRDYLSNHVAQVHLFRQRISIRNVDFNAYQ